MGLVRGGGGYENRAVNLPSEPHPAAKLSNFRVRRRNPGPPVPGRNNLKPSSGPEKHSPKLNFWKRRNLRACFQILSEL